MHGSLKLDVQRSKINDRLVTAMPTAEGSDLSTPLRLMWHEAVVDVPHSFIPGLQFLEERCSTWDMASTSTHLRVSGRSLKWGRRTSVCYLLLSHTTVGTPRGTTPCRKFGSGISFNPPSVGLITKPTNQAPPVAASSSATVVPAA